MYHRSNRQRRQHLLWRPHARLELIVAIIIVLLVVAAILVFLLIYHDLPLRTGEPT